LILLLIFFITDFSETIGSFLVVIGCKEWDGPLGNHSEHKRGTWITEYAKVSADLVGHETEQCYQMSHTKLIV